MYATIAAVDPARGVLHEYAPLGLADRADIRGRSLVDEAADGAEVPVGVLALESGKSLQGLLVKPAVNLLRLVGEVEAPLCGRVPLGLGVLDEPGIHGGELVGLPVQGCLQVAGRIADPVHGAEVGGRVHRLRGGDGTEHLRDAGIPLFVRLIREGQVLPVGHRLAGESLLQVFHGPLVHDETPFER